MSSGWQKKSSGASGSILRVHGRSITASIATYAAWIPFGPASRAMLSSRIRCAAFVGAKPAKAARPRYAEVLPVQTIAPKPASIIAGVASVASWSSAIVLISKARIILSGSISM